MRKIIIILFLTCFAFVVYGCKPALPSKLFSYVELLEKVKLRGVSSDFFVEVCLFTLHDKELCRLTLIPSRLGLEDISVGFLYGKIQGNFHYDSRSNTYSAEYEYDNTHSSIALKTNELQTIPLISVAQTPHKELLAKAYSHFEPRIKQHIKNDKFLQRIQIKILSDMSANAFFYVGFIGNDEYYAAAFDIDTLEIIADYYK